MKDGHGCERQTLFLEVSGCNNDRKLALRLVRLDASTVIKLQSIMIEAKGLARTACFYWLSLSLKNLVLRIRGQVCREMALRNPFPQAVAGSQITIRDQFWCF